MSLKQNEKIFDLVFFNLSYNPVKQRELLEPGKWFTISRFKLSFELRD